MIRLRSLLFVAPLCAVFACDSSDDEGPPPVAHAHPFACASTVGARDAGELVARTKGGGADTCVVLASASYELDAPLVLPSGIIVVGGKDVRPTLRTKGSADGAVVRLEGGKLAHVAVADAPGVGVAVGMSGGALHDVSVTGARGAAVSSIGELRLEASALERNAVGLFASGGHVVMTGGRIAESGSTSLTSGVGLVVTGGAKVELDGVAVEKNSGTGILVDGKGSSLVAKSVKVMDNGERGIWAQGIEGTLEAPSLRLEQTEIARNKIVGVGALESRGIIVVGGRVGDTIAAPVVTNLATTEQVGDGIGVFSGSGDVRIDGTLLEANARAAGIIDGSDRGIIVVGGKVSAGASGLKVVIQNTTAKVDIADDLKSVPPKALGVSASKVALPSIQP